MTKRKRLSRLRFEALAGYTRKPEIVLYIEEVEWYATLDERLIGMLARDVIDDTLAGLFLLATSAGVSARLI